MSMQTPIDAQRIVIIGMGSRGLSVLGQLIGACRRNPRRPLTLELFDPQSPGSGLHLPEQPDYLMLNTMAGQICAFSMAHPAWQAGEAPGLTFLQWCTANELRLNDRGHVSDSAEGRPITFADFVPRKLLGRYLRDCYHYLLQLCPSHLRIRQHRDSVIGCRAKPANQGFFLHTQSRQHIDADAVFLTLGHAPQPLASGDGKRVAVEGLGLCAMDRIAAMTEGRGGRYVRDGSLSGWRYRPGGQEPQIYLFSRSGLPFHCRPKGPPLSVAVQRLFFTAQAIVALREASPNRQLDFQQHILPLIEDEMRGVFYLATANLQAPQCLESVRQRLLGTRSATERQAVFSVLAGKFGCFEPQDYLNVVGWQGDPADYAQWFRDWIANDLARSRQGVEASPLTQALEVWRNSRDLLRLAADDNGLSEASTLEFYGTWAALSNRLVGGPQHERYEDLLALIEAGVVTPLPPMQIGLEQGGIRLMGGGQAEAPAIDNLILARNAPSGLTLNRSALIDDLLSQGLISAAHAYPADGIAVDAQSRALQRDGQANPRLWVLGPGVEGSRFYNHYVPTPEPACKAALEAYDAVQGCLKALRSAVVDLAVH